MQLLIKKEVAEELGFENLEQFGITKDSWRSWREEVLFKLETLDRGLISQLRIFLEENKTKRGVNVLLYDLNAWAAIQSSGSADKKPRTVRMFETLLQQYLVDLPNHWLFKRHEQGVMLCYYVVDVVYNPPREMTGGGKTPPTVQMHLAFEEIGGKSSTTATFDASDVLGHTTAEALADKGYLIEDEALVAEYYVQKARYTELAQAVGKQFWGRGRANVIDKSEYEKDTFILDRFGEPSRVIIDVFREDGKAIRESSAGELHEFFWPNIARSTKYDEETDTYAGSLDDDDTLERPVIEIPIHPWVIVFHLSKHVRAKCHIAQLDEYIYDRQLGEKLVLPDDQKKLVKLLIDTKGGVFQDIVQGKGGGAVVLLTGEPGVGKTLTAEVYAESEERPLYSVQCSQLGTSPDHLEANLLQVFQRARRWNAVMLLDEADVYVHERGDSMQQNAIVGVFLRVLEYQGSTLFLTSNRPDDVDDAIASRCIARLHYKTPDVEHAKQIWKVLSETAGVPIKAKTIEAVVAANPTMSGRDIKNILKLTNLLRAEGADVTFDDVEYVKQFKPTGRLFDRGVGPNPGTR